MTRFGVDFAFGRPGGAAQAVKEAHELAEMWMVGPLKEAAV